MDKITFLNSEGGDWVGVYLGKELIHEGHSVSGKELCEALSLEFEFHYMTDKWLNNKKNRGSMPFTLPDDVEKHVVED